MKTLKALARNLCRPVTLAALGIALLATTSRAATIKFETKVAGYSSAGWILVLPEMRAQLGGRVTYDRNRGCWITDRVQRGEQIRVTVSPSTRTERCHNGSITGIFSASGSFTFGFVPMPFGYVFEVSKFQNFDNVYIWVYTTSGLFEKRIPIGLRP